MFFSQILSSTSVNAGLSLAVFELCVHLNESSDPEQGDLYEDEFLGLTPKKSGLPSLFDFFYGIVPKEVKFLLEKPYS